MISGRCAVQGISRMLKDWRVLCFFVIIAIPAIWILWWASNDFILTHEICRDPKTHEDCESYNVLSYSAWLLSKAIDPWSILITAVATFFVAAFTFTLWRSSEKMWKVTRRSVDIAERTLTDLERPYLFILDWNWLLIGHPKADGEPAWVYVVANGGKLPAIIKRVSIGTSFDRSIPSLIEQPLGHELLTAPLIGAGERRELIQRLDDENDDVPAHEYEIRGGRATIPGSRARRRPSYGEDFY
jgi:hypothetical protein